MNRAPVPLPFPFIKSTHPDWDATFESDKYRSFRKGVVR